MYASPGYYSMDFGAESVRAAVDAARSNLPGLQDASSDAAHLDAAIDWLCHSQDVTGTCGSAATYNLLLGWEDAYPETSGYIVPTLFRYVDCAGANQCLGDDCADANPRDQDTEGDQS